MTRVSDTTLADIGAALMREAQTATTELRDAYAAVATAEVRLDRAIEAVEANLAAREHDLVMREQQILSKSAALTGNEWRPH